MLNESKQPEPGRGYIPKEIFYQIPGIKQRSPTYHTASKVEYQLFNKSRKSGNKYSDISDKERPLALGYDAIILNKKKGGT